MNSYQYTQAVNPDRLTQDIQQSSIVTALDHIDTVGTSVTIWFKAALSSGDQTTLDAVVAATINSPLVNIVPALVETVAPKTPDNRDLVATNRIGPGYTLYPTGAGDNMSTGAYGTGPDLLLTQAAPTQNFQLLNNWYIVGGHANWEGASLDDMLNGWIVAPGTTGATGSTGGNTGNVDKYAIPGTGGTLHMFIPNQTSTGAFNLNLAGTLANCPTVLQCTPVPSAGGGGWYDYDSDTNVLTVNPSMQGNFNLYDFPINLFKLCNRIRGTAVNGGQTNLEATDTVGKLLYNTWQLKVTLTTTNSSMRVALWLMAAAKKNL
jgi:hypothetical protein